MTVSEISQKSLKNASRASTNIEDVNSAMCTEEETASAGAPQPMVDVVVPVHNEEHVLAESLCALHAFLTAELPYTFSITVADNASTDGTLAVARVLAEELPEVRVLHLEEKGRGRALRHAWLSSEADVLAYMDVDLSTDLAALPELIEPLVLVHADVAIGSRLAPGAEVTRSIKRELISRTYNVLLRLSLQAGFSDAQCGFKAIRREVAEQLLPLVQDEAWFFDTELLYQAQRHRMSIHEVPVRWVEDPDSRVHIVSTVHEDLRGIRRLRKSRRDQARQVQAAPQQTAGLPV